MVDQCGALEFEFPPKKTSVEGLESVGRALAE